MTTRYTPPEAQPGNPKAAGERARINEDPPADQPRAIHIPTTPVYPLWDPSDSFSVLTSLERKYQARGGASDHICPTDGVPGAASTGRFNGHYDASFSMDWDIVGYLLSTFGSSSVDLGQVITISGQALSAYATICSEYLEYSWPETGQVLLRVLQQAVDDFQDSAVVSTQTATEGQDLSIELELRSGPSPRLSVDVHGTWPRLRDIAEQLSWFGVVMRIPDGHLCAMQSGITLIGGNQFEIRCREYLVSYAERPCWFALFGSAVLAPQFSVPQRNDAIGLEIPMAIMAALAGARHAVEFEGGVVLKGPVMMLTPVEKRGDVVQWHLVSLEHDHQLSGVRPAMNGRLSYGMGVRLCKNRSLLDEFDLQSISSTRAVVGWCREAKLNLGSETAQYQDIRFSNAKHCAANIRFSSMTFGFSHFGTAQAQFQYSRRSATRTQQEGTFESKLTTAEQISVVLYDTLARRGWSVSALEALLHIAQHRIYLDRSRDRDQAPPLLNTDRRKEAVRKVILDNRNSKLLDGTLEEKVNDWFSQLECSRDAVASDAPGLSLRFKHNVIEGFESNGIVFGHSSFYLSETPNQHTSGRWELLTRHIDALVLFASGLGDVITPAEDLAGLCISYRRLPTDAGYLATTAELLQSLFMRAGHEGQNRLTRTGLRLDRAGSILFEDCPDSEACRCSRVQRIVTAERSGVIRPEHITPGSAVIFGSSGTAVASADTGANLDDTDDNCNVPSASIGLALKILVYRFLSRGKFRARPERETEIRVI